MDENRRAAVFVHAKGWHLQTALAGTLSGNLSEMADVRMGLPDGSHHLAVVVTTDGTASLDDVFELSEKGSHVVILAALPDRHARRLYSEAGARAYLPMMFSQRRLLAIVGALVTMLVAAA
jgi:hypothetical protein